MLGPQLEIPQIANEAHFGYKTSTCAKENEYTQYK
jgi:hypothetical protein